LVGYAEKKSVTDRFEQFLGASYADNPALWGLASPISYVDPGDGAVFVIGHGSLDQESPIEPVIQFVRKTKESGVDTHFVEIEGGSHFFWSSDLDPELILEMRRVFEPIMQQLLQP
jgi:dipeptidyl aminopeptidase/acylaminoacyl peptidase